MRGDLTARMRLLLQAYCLELSKLGIHAKPYRDKSLPEFSCLPRVQQKEIYNRLRIAYEAHVQVQLFHINATIAAYRKRRSKEILDL